MPTSGCLLTRLPFLLLHVLCNIIQEIDSKHYPHENLWTFALGTTLLAIDEQTDLHRFNANSAQSNRIIPGRLGLTGNLWGDSNSCPLWLKCLEYLKTKVSFSWKVLNRQCPFICQKILNIDLWVCTKDSKLKNTGWYCCLTELVPAGHDLNWKWTSLHSSEPLTCLVP